LICDKIEGCLLQRKIEEEEEKGEKERGGPLVKS
jgi:hypothetical protein